MQSHNSASHSLKMRRKDVLLVVSASPLMLRRCQINVPRRSSAIICKRWLGERSESRRAQRLRVTSHRNQGTSSQTVQCSSDTLRGSPWAEYNSLFEKNSMKGTTLTLRLVVIYIVDRCHHLMQRVVVTRSATQLALNTSGNTAHAHRVLERSACDGGDLTRKCCIFTRQASSATA